MVEHIIQASTEKNMDSDSCQHQCEHALNTCRLGKEGGMTGVRHTLGLGPLGRARPWQR